MLIGLPDGGVLSRERLLEGTAPHIRESLNVDKGDFSQLLELPTLAMPEVAPGGSSDVARVGTLRSISSSGSNYKVQFMPNPNMDAIPVNNLLANQDAFEIEQPWGFHRTRLMVKDIDLYRTLLELDSNVDVVRPSRKYLNFPEGPAAENLVVVMMPFSSEFDSVWRAIQSATYSIGLTCSRADSIWDEDTIMDDVVKLLWRARLVVTDYTGHNANVFYETGIAHTLGRQCIPLAQSVSEIPFDLKHIRTLPYENSESGLKRLEFELSERLRKLMLN